ncbi:MAG: hypothetical protein IT236_05680 [Bacteroidia bacterium]|nr:hypothetical protein [Bacteroidia bacterium]
MPAKTIHVFCFGMTPAFLNEKKTKTEAVKIGYVLIETQFGKDVILTPISEKDDT